MIYRRVIQGLLFTFLGFVLIAAVQGPFLNEDSEKIHLNKGFFETGSLWLKLSQPEAGYESSYFRPVNNVVLTGLARAFGVESAAPFRMAGSLAFMCAIFALIVMARRLNLSVTTAWVCAAFFAFHPFNSWFYFQGAWFGNSLALVLMIVSWFVYEYSLNDVSSNDWFWGLTLLGLVYAAGLCKDSAILVVGAMLPLVFSGQRSVPARRWFLWGMMLVGALLLLWHRFNVLRPDPRFTKIDIGYGLSHSGWLLLNYLWMMLSATNFNYGRNVPQGPGWPLTIFLLGVFFFVLWRLRRRPVEAALWWCCGVFALESVIASFPSFWILPTRVEFLIAAIVLFAAKFWQGSRLRNHRYFSRPVQKTLVVAALIWFLLPSAGQVFLSRNEQVFYAYHNETPYSWKLLYVEGRLHLKNEEWELAEDRFQKSLVLHQTTVIYNSLGLALLRQGRYGESIHNFIEALCMNPWKESAAVNLAEALLRSALPLNDGADFWKSMERVPERATIFNNLGVLFAKKGDFEKANIFFRQALRVDPSFPPAKHNLLFLSN